MCIFMGDYAQSTIYIKRTLPNNICILKTISNPISYVSKNSRFFNLEILNETLSFTAPRFLLKQWSMVSLPLDVCGDALTKDERYTDPMQQFPLSLSILSPLHRTKLPEQKVLITPQHRPQCPGTHYLQSPTTERATTAANSFRDSATMESVSHQVPTLS